MKPYAANGRGPLRSFTGNAVRLAFLVAAILALPLRAGLPEDLAKLRDAYAATNNADFVATLDSAQSSGTVIRYQWRNPNDGFVYRRQDVAKIGRSDFESPDAIDQSSRWNPKGFFVIVGRRAVRSSISGLDWLPKYDFAWVTRITTRNRDYRHIPCSELRAEVKLPTGDQITVLYWIDRSRPFIRGCEVFNEQNESVEKFDFGTVDFKPQLDINMFLLPVGVNSEERKLDRTLERQVYRGNDSQAIRQLQNAINHTLTRSFTASLKYDFDNQGKPGTYHYQVYLQPVAGRRLPLVRIDQVEIIRQQQTITASRLVNKQGAFLIYGSHAIKSQFPWIGIPPYLVLDAEPGAQVTAQKLPDGNTLYTLRLASVPEGVDRKKFAMLRRYYVRADAAFIYAWESFTQGGKMIFRYEFENIRFDPEFPSGIFDLPSRVKMHKADESDQIRERFYREMSNQLAPSWFQRQYEAAQGFFDNNAGSLLAWGGIIAFWLAIAAALLAILLKIRSRIRTERQKEK